MGLSTSYSSQPRACSSKAQLAMQLAEQLGQAPESASETCQDPACGTSSAFGRNASANHHQLSRLHRRAVSKPWQYVQGGLPAEASGSYMLCQPRAAWTPDLNPEPWTLLQERSQPAQAACPGWPTCRSSRQLHAVSAKRDVLLQERSQQAQAACPGWHTCRSFRQLLGGPRRWACRSLPRGSCSACSGPSSTPSPCAGATRLSSRHHVGCA